MMHLHHLIEKALPLLSKLSLGFGEDRVSGAARNHVTGAAHAVARAP
jgi:hypothetical protein